MFSPCLTHNSFSSFKALVEATALLRHGAAGTVGDPSAEDHQSAERDILRKVQIDSFPEDFDCLVAGKPVPSSSHLIMLAPEYDSTVGLIRVGGRLRRSLVRNGSLQRSVVNIGFYAVEKQLNDKNTHALIVKGGELNQQCLRWQISLRPDFRYSNHHSSLREWIVLAPLRLK